MSALAIGVVDEEAWRETLTAFWLAVMEDFGEAIQDGLTVSISTQNSQKALSDVFGVLLPQVIGFAKSWAAESVKQINGTTRALIRSAITEALREGFSIPRLEAEIDKLYLEQIIPNRSEVIARTETIRASNFGTQEAAKATGLALEREWLTTLDGRERGADPNDKFNHRDANGQRRLMGTPFQISGEDLMFPGDPRGSPGNTIQCRCVELFHEITPPE